MEARDERRVLVSLHTCLPLLAEPGQMIELVAETQNHS